MDKVPIIIIGSVVAIGILFFALTQFFPNVPKPAPLPEGIILFYGEDCPHCKLVDEFVKENKVKEKIIFSELEVYYNKENAKLLVSAAQKCGEDISQGIGVPFLYDGKNCFIGDVNIIDFFKEKIGL